MKKIGQVLQIAFTFIGTVVGAGFATGQEILQFFTRFGSLGGLAIVIAVGLFVWLGAKMMLIAGQIGAKSYEDLNRVLFGRRAGYWVSLFMLVVLFGVNAVMLAGAGSVFVEHLNLSYQAGLLITMALCFVLLGKGMRAIVALNSVVVPLMVLFTLLIVARTLEMPEADRFLTLGSDHSPWAVWTSPLLYAAFNLSMSQAVLVPLGAEIADRRIIIPGAAVGGIGIGFLLLAGHFALSANMPGITQFAIPMGGVARQLGSTAQAIYLCLIFAEIFSTLIADVYGLTLQLEEKLRWPRRLIVFGVLVVCFFAGQIGFASLLSLLYPVFGIVSLGWMVLMIRKKSATA